MSDLGIGDLGAAYGLSTVNEVKLKHSDNKDRTSLKMEDFLNLMMVSLQNQSLDSTMDTSEMMNQMVQMSMVQAINDISTLVQDSTTLNYAASLVGKDVTIGKWVGNKLEEKEGTVMGTGTMGGKQVIFLEGDDKPYYLNEILGIGKLPEKIDTSDGTTEATTQIPTVNNTQTPPVDNNQTPPAGENDSGNPPADGNSNETQDGFEINPGE